ncbi:methyltransferase domain-containing protein [Janthinobacterium sp. FW305-128]|uniref:class I SAM-dependent methyltransferase n=1 Tax=Janthinobacterium sp. FW305-128 TaxID=2775055 RepID=UPI001E41F885|nr:methyltransferase domain-containing protein [Janthinobacterium sp. FW305-128]MCC7683429.1 methyltransferase domain-containing protein [Janthinobacterium sp. FW305-128]
MHASPVPGTEGYADNAGQLITRYAGVIAADKYKVVSHLLPRRAGAVLDIGAGTGADSAWLASLGHKVVAVEPVAAFREAGMQAHASPDIEWVDDSLPALSVMTARETRFDLVVLAAVWMHLAAEERSAAMENIGQLLKPGALLVMSLRHGPAPENRRIFDVSASETIDLAARHHLAVVLSAQAPSVQQQNRHAGVSWSWLVFQR